MPPVASPLLLPPAAQKRSTAVSGLAVAASEATVVALQPIDLG